MAAYFKIFTFDLRRKGILWQLGNDLIVCKLNDTRIIGFVQSDNFQRLYWIALIHNQSMTRKTFCSVGVQVIYLNIISSRNYDWFVLCKWNYLFSSNFITFVSDKIKIDLLLSFSLILIVYNYKIICYELNKQIFFLKFLVKL